MAAAEAEGTARIRTNSISHAWQRNAEILLAGDAQFILHQNFDIKINRLADIRDSFLFGFSLTYTTR